MLRTPYLMNTYTFFFSPSVKNAVCGFSCRFRALVIAETELSTQRPPIQFFFGIAPTDRARLTRLSSSFEMLRLKTECSNCAALMTE